MPGLAQFPIDADRWPLVRYRFDLEADRAFSHDMVVEGGKARMEPSENALADVSLHCDRATFVLMMYKRLTLDSLGLMAHVTVEGDQTLVTVLDQWLKQP
jgi:predicted lipid carrier protein YhbT